MSIWNETIAETERLVFMSESNRQKYSYISFAKAVGILGVTLYHCFLFYVGTPFVPMQAEKPLRICQMLDPYFDAFFVPGFILCSGFLFAKGAQSRKRTMGQTLWERVRRLIVPYYLVGTFWLVPMYTIFNIPCFGRPDNANFLEGLRAMVLGQFSDHLWFLWGLWWTTIVFILLLPLCRNRKYHPILFVIITVISVLEYYFVSGIPYFKLFSAGTYNWLFFAGMICFFYRYRFFKAKRFIIWLLFATDIALVVFLIYATGNGGFFMLGWLLKAAGGFAVFLISVLAERYALLDRLFQTKLWDFTYHHTWEIYLVNLPVPHLFFRLFGEILKLPPWAVIPLIIVCTFPTLYLLAFGVAKADEWLDKIVIFKNKQGKAK